MSETLVQQILRGYETRRADIKLSRKQWLKRAGIAESTFYRWLQGATSPRLRTLDKLGAALASYER
jgi:predicted transcriptional regulator